MSLWEEFGIENYELGINNSSALILHTAHGSNYELGIMN
jgi:hypothetical protein